MAAKPGLPASAVSSIGSLVVTKRCSRRADGTPGGTLSIIAKSPQFTPGTDISAEVGNCNFNLNVNNLFNKQTWFEAQARSSVAPYPGTEVSLTMTVHIR